MDTRKRWQFLWCDENSPPTNGDAHDWRSKVIAVATLETAMNRMLAFVRGKPFVCLIDYECAALHIPYSHKNHAAHFHRIDRTDHELSEYVG